MEIILLSMLTQGVLMGVNQSGPVGFVTNLTK
jgi:hypothetical protein